MKKKIILIASFVLAALLIYSTSQIIVAEKNYIKADRIYEQSRIDSFHITESKSEDASSTEPEDSFPDVFVDFEFLKSTNPEIVGWLWIPDTEISYPLLKTEDNQKYLSLSFDCQYTNSGSIFIDFRNSQDFEDGNTIIYGHNMKSGGMFGCLKDFSDNSYLSEHSELYIFTESQVLKYRIFASYTTSCDSQSYTSSFLSETDFFDFLVYIQACSEEALESVPEKQAPLLTLSTCTKRRSDRFVVHAYFTASKACAPDS